MDILNAMYSMATPPDGTPWWLDGDVAHGWVRVTDPSVVLGHCGPRWPHRADLGGHRTCCFLHHGSSQPLCLHSSALATPPCKPQLGHLRKSNTSCTAWTLSISSTWILWQRQPAVCPAQRRTRSNYRDVVYSIFFLATVWPWVCFSTPHIPPVFSPIIVDVSKNDP